MVADSMGGLLELEIVAATADAVRARVPVTDGLCQPLGLVHGGVYASIADQLATAHTPKAAHAISNQTSFLRPITRGTIHASARARHRGRTTWVWEVDITDDERRLCALVRVTVAVRP
jgi:1,4-dihydroxy-2-naphthoyl-CoA hydrolase